ncbi:MAG TPA: class I SAM-dependent methyltransferase [Bacteroidota bacterium]|nr:class I SAM-dependent methyltransferase [Bacteroidota bacterium]
MHVYPKLNSQEHVNRYFTLEAGYWDSVYRREDLVGAIYRRRQTAAIEMLGRTSLTSEAKILEIGCGSGQLTVALAKQGFFVDAMDSVSAMLELTRRNVAAAGVGDRVHTHLGDVHRLGFEARSFDAIIALGVLPWIFAPNLALKEMERVAKLGGYLLFTVDNRNRLNNLLDPGLNPFLEPLKTSIKNLLEVTRLRPKKYRAELPRMHSIGEVTTMLSEHNLDLVAMVTVGFGPFTFFGKRILPDALGRAVDHFFQWAANKQLPPFRTTGSHCLVLAAKHDVSDEITVTEELLEHVGVAV